MANVRVSIDVGDDGVAVITICNPPVNALSTQSKLRFIPLSLSLSISISISNQFDGFLLRRDLDEYTG